MISQENWHLCINNERTKIIECPVLLCSMCDVTGGSFDISKEPLITHTNQYAEKKYMEFTKGDKFHRIHDYYKNKLFSDRKELQIEINHFKFLKLELENEIEKLKKDNIELRKKD